MIPPPVPISAAMAAAWPAGERVLVVAPLALSARLAWEEQAGHLQRAGLLKLVGGSVPFVGA